MSGVVPVLSVQRKIKVYAPLDEFLLLKIFSFQTSVAFSGDLRSAVLTRTIKPFM